MRIGDYLLQKGLVSPSDLDRALEFQERSGERLGKILISLGLIRRFDLFGALADLWGYPFVDLLKRPPQPEVARRFDSQVLIRERFIPISRTERAVEIAAAREPDDAMRALVGEKFPGMETRFFVTTEWDVDRAIREIFRDEIIDRAVLGLYYRNPDECAYTVLTHNQFLAVAALVLLLLLSVALAPRETLIGINLAVNVFFMASVLFKFVVSIAGSQVEHFEPVTDAEIAALRNEDLPTYTVLVPAYKEANVVGLLMQNLRDLDYPISKLEVLLLLEEDDQETLEAAKAAHPPETVTFVVIPEGQPKTKPKACNVGLFFAKGEYLVIFDAEDKPDPDQLKRAIVSFRKYPQLAAACVQGALNFVNRDENFLTRMFTLEYSYWFDYMLPGLDRLHLPIPLGGTSNHFRTDILRELGGWDPFNVTEDADLGIRASARGYRVGVINSTTYEEANAEYGNWLRQRSRWIKGYMQTVLVHTRHPLALYRRLGLRNMLGFMMLIAGTPLTFLCALPLWLLFAVVAATHAHFLDPLFPPIVLYVSLFNLLIGNGLMIYLNMLAVFKRRYYGLLPFALLNPIYWLLHSMAAYKALWQLITKPFYWEKTTHGISREMYRAPVGQTS